MADKRIDQLLEWIQSSSNSLKIATDTAIPYIKETLYGSELLIEGCPSRASAAEMEMRRIKKYINEVTSLVNDLEKEIFSKYSDKK